MTKSPVSSWVVNVGLCLPRRTRAISLARRPSGLSVASTTHHVRFAAADTLVATNDFFTSPAPTLDMTNSSTPRKHQAGAAGAGKLRGDPGSVKATRGRFRRVRRGKVGALGR